jgi:hypothetical protein
MWIKHFLFRDIRSFNFLFVLFLNLIIIIIIKVLLEIPPFVKDPKVNKEFNIIEKRIIECNENRGCRVFFDRKIEENRNIYNMF